MYAGIEIWRELWQCFGRIAYSDQSRQRAVTFGVDQNDATMGFRDLPRSWHRRWQVKSKTPLVLAERSFSHKFSQEPFILKCLPNQPKVGDYERSIRGAVVAAATASWFNYPNRQPASTMVNADIITVCHHHFNTSTLATS